MEVSLSLLELADLHPELEWDLIVVAAASVLRSGGREPPHPFHLKLDNIPGYGSGSMKLSLDSLGVPLQRIARIEKTYENARCIEWAAIAITAVGLALAGNHQIIGVNLRGCGADYFVDEVEHHLEIAGRSRHSDVGAAIKKKWERLKGAKRGCYVSVCEFETLTGRPEFTEMKKE